jgi:hypothetical protein
MAETMQCAAASIARRRHDCKDAEEQVREREAVGQRDNGSGTRPSWPIVGARRAQRREAPTLPGMRM